MTFQGLKQAGQSPSESQASPTSNLAIRASDAQEYGLQSVLTPGTITWEHPAGITRSTVDAILASEGMVESQTCCRVYGTDHGSDHRPIEMRFDLPVDQPKDRRRRLQFQKADGRSLGAQLRHAYHSQISRVKSRKMNSRSMRRIPCEWSRKISMQEFSGPDFRPT